MGANETPVLAENIIVGVLYFLKQTMVLMGVTVFIAWLVDMILLWDPVSTMLTLCMVGVVLFLLLPVLRMPFYIAFVTVLVIHDLVRGTALSSSDLLIAAVLGTDIKLRAVAVQQNGVPFSESMSIKKAIWCHHEVEDFIADYVVVA
eukprot:4059593-Amphidinium_carterae.1